MDIKNVVLCEIKDLKSKNLDDSITDLIYDYQVISMGVLITDGKCDVADTSHGVFMAKNLYLSGGLVKCDIDIINKDFNFLNFLDTYEGVFYKTLTDKNGNTKITKGNVSFIPVKNKTNNTITHFQLDNKYTNIEKMKESLVSKTKDNSLESGDKYLNLDLNFILPKGFNGNIDDAFLELYKYVKSKDFEITNKKSLEDFDECLKIKETNNEPLYGNININTLEL